MRPDVILLNGTSSAGKTSLSHALQRLAGSPLLHVSLDTFTDMFLWDAIKDEQERRACHMIGVANFHHALAHFAADSYALVVDHLLLTPEWDRLTREALAHRRVCRVGVHCPLEVLTRREQSRPDRHPGLAASQFAHIHRNQVYDVEVDTSLHSSAECAEQVLAFIRSR